MDSGAIAILVAGLGLAGFLYIRSQQQQAAALAAAQAAPGPGLIQKVENTAKVVATQAPKLAYSAVTGVTSSIAGGAASAVGFVKGLF